MVLHEVAWGVGSVAGGRFWNLFEVGKGAFGVGVEVVTLVVFFGKTNPFLGASYCWGSRPPVL